MSKKKNWLATELLYVALAPLLVLVGILIYGVLLDQWYKDPVLILNASGVVYGVILILRIIRWIVGLFSK